MRCEINTGKFPVNKKFVQAAVDKCIKIHGKTRNGKRKYAKIFDNGELSIVFVSNKDIKKWNKIYRKIDKPTDVLSFGSLICIADTNIRMDTNDANNTNKMGGYAEILISYELAKKQAKENKISIKKEIEKLLIHGILHLLGYNHENNKEAEEMEKIETRIYCQSTQNKVLL